MAGVVADFHAVIAMAVEVRRITEMIGIAGAELAGLLLEPLGVLLRPAELVVLVAYSVLGVLVLWAWWYSGSEEDLVRSQLRLNTMDRWSDIAIRWAPCSVVVLFLIGAVRASGGASAPVAALLLTAIYVIWRPIRRISRRSRAMRVQFTVRPRLRFTTHCTLITLLALLLLPMLDSRLSVVQGPFGLEVERLPSAPDALRLQIFFLFLMLPYLALSAHAGRIIHWANYNMSYALLRARSSILASALIALAILNLLGGMSEDGVLIVSAAAP